MFSIWYKGRHILFFGFEESLMTVFAFKRQHLSPFNVFHKRVAKKFNHYKQLHYFHFSNPSPAPFYNSKTMPNTKKRYAKKRPQFVAESCSFKHFAIRANSMEGDEFIVKADAIIAIKKGGEENGKPYSFVYDEFGGKRFVVEGDEKQVAAKLNWVIDDVTT